MSETNEKEKIALISHIDLDGLAAARVVNEVVQADLIKFVNYHEINDNLLEELKKNKIKRAIFTDLALENEEFLKEAEKFLKVLWIDHHTFPRDYNSEKTVYLNVQGFCATYICYYLFSKISNLEKLDWLVASASISDWLYFNNQEFMSKIFKKYSDKFEIQDSTIRKSGLFWDFQWNLSLLIIYFAKDLNYLFNNFPVYPHLPENLKKHSDEIQAEITHEIEKVEREKISIKEGYFAEISPKFNVGSIISSILSGKYWNKKIIIINEKGSLLKISARRQDKKENLPELLKELIKNIPRSTAGGHIAAAGATIPIEYKEKFKQNLFRTLSP